MGRVRTAAVAGFGLMLATAAAAAPAADPPRPAVAAPAPALAATPAFVPRSFVSHHEGDFGGQHVRYTAAAGDTVLLNDAGAPAATLFSFSYIRDDVKDRTSRPVLFVWNGGPGSASLWEHLGVFGPKRVALADAVHPPTTGPFRLEDNPDALLDVADVVLIDPPGTGFSRLLPGGDPKSFYGVEQDGRAMVEFIDDWLRQHDRLNSPHFLIGESYGTTRAMVVARMLMGGPFSAVGKLVAIPVDGVVLMGGGVANDATGESSGDLAYVEALPTMAAIAWYHGRIDRAGRTLEQVMAEAEAFAPDYLKALYAGDRLPAAEADTVAARLSALTGLSAAYVRQHDLRVGMGAFRSELLRDKGLVVGAYDGRYTLPAGADPGPLDPVGDDPAMGQYSPAFIGAFDAYLRDDLGVRLPEAYDAIDFKVNGRWDYASSPPGGPTTRAQDMAAAMRRNPKLQLMMVGGAYDAVVHAGAIAYSVAHAGLPLDRVTVKTYDSGHMAYLGHASEAALARDLRAFIARATAK